MTNQNFIDLVKIFGRSGKGGAGSVHFIRTKQTAWGGPDGGDGGRGGHVILKGNSQLWTLLHLRYTKHLFAGDGESGGRQLMTGAAGRDVIIEVPLGTIVCQSDTGNVLGEVTNHDQTLVILEGGRGGKGNDFFKSATMQAPKFSQPGEPGKEMWLTVELKILADVGLVGFPNAGKSTLLSKLSAAKPEIADYPFTTLTPNLGIVAYHDRKSFIMADIPGIIEGASEGRGLGLRFLRHIERNSLLLFMIPVDTKNIADEYNILLKELQTYNPELLDKDRLLAITKSDLIDYELIKEMEKELPLVPHVFISSHSRLGLTKLKEMLWQMLNKFKTGNHD